MELVEFFFTWMFSKSHFLLLVSPLAPTAALNKKVIIRELMLQPIT